MVMFKMLIKCSEAYKHFCSKCEMTIPKGSFYSQELKQSKGGAYLKKTGECCMSETEHKKYKESLLKTPKVTVPGEEADGQISML